MSKPKRYFGWRKDSLDARDKHFAAIMPIRKELLPPYVDLSSQCSTVENQQDLGSCVFNSTAGAYEFLELKDNMPYMEYSRLFVYYNTRVIEHTVNEDAGAEIRDAIKSLASTGVCSEALWPYVTSRFKKKPTKKCYIEAQKHKITSYYRITSLDGLRQSLADGFPVCFGFAVFSSFETIGSDGMMPIPNPETEEMLGGHAVLATGYDDEKRLIKVRNSWGCQWGANGSFFMSYSFIANKQMASDFWTIRRET